MPHTVCSYAISFQFRSGNANHAAIRTFDTKNTFLLSFNLGYSVSSCYHNAMSPRDNQAYPVTPDPVTSPWQGFFNGIADRRANYTDQGT